MWLVKLWSYFQNSYNNNVGHIRHNQDSLIMFKSYKLDIRFIFMLKYCQSVSSYWKHTSLLLIYISNEKLTWI